MLPEHLCEGTPAHDGSVLFVGAPVVHGLQLEFKIPGVLGQLARQDDAGDEEQQRCDQHKAADDQRGEARNQTGLEISAQHRQHKADAEHRQNGRQNAEEHKRAVVFKQPADRTQHLEAV